MTSLLLQLSNSFLIVVLKLSHNVYYVSQYDTACSRFRRCLVSIHQFVCVNDSSLLIHAPASKPIASSRVLQNLSSRPNVPADVNTSVNSGPRLVPTLAALESQAQEKIVQIKADNCIIVIIDTNGRDPEDKSAEDNNAQGTSNKNSDSARGKEEDVSTQQLILRTINQALLADQEANAAGNEMDNVLRAMVLTQKEPEKSAVILIVQEVKTSVEIEVQVDDNKERRRVDASVFIQEAIVANRGKQETETVMGTYDALRQSTVAIVYDDSQYSIPAP